MTERIPLFPLDAVVFPGEAFPLHVFEERYLVMLEDCETKGLPVGVALARPEGEVEHPPVEVGTACRIMASEKLPDGRRIVLTAGEHRFRVRGVVSDRLYQEADVEWLDEPLGDMDAAERAESRVRRELARIGAEPVAEDAEGPIETSYAVAAALEAPATLRQRLLESESAEERLELEEAILRQLAPDE
ncbi:MAG TPA: LON peptidase substrate-binding domain-containing protein [Candidatus Thermoplasmatota archaeon]|nr:LON peptidase substrate-binding domain-containing protein [Candidatus Thermoplasmatota archaeon]